MVNFMDGDRSVWFRSLKYKDVTYLDPFKFIIPFEVKQLTNKEPTDQDYVYNDTTNYWRKKDTKRHRSDGDVVVLNKMRIEDTKEKVIRVVQELHMCSHINYANIVENLNKW